MRELAPLETDRSVKIHVNVTLRKNLIYEYQEQESEELGVVIIGEDGEQKVRQSVLENCSDWFYKQLRAREGFGNRLEFRYDKGEAKFRKSCIQNFLDLMHGIRLNLTIPDCLNLIGFIHYEGKKDSHFERNLLLMLYEKIKEFKLSIDQKLLVSCVCRTFDNFTDHFVEVSVFIGLKI